VRNFLADSFYYAFLGAMHICATIGHHCQFFPTPSHRSKYCPYLQERIFESHNIFQANECFVIVQGTVIFTDVTNCALTMSLLSVMASAHQQNELTCNSNSHKFIPISDMRLVQVRKERLAS
jgi:hypothetical protein